MAKKQRIAVIGAGLCGSILSTLLRNKFDVTVIEPSRKPRPLTGEIICEQGDVNTSINRAEGLGGTTNYWHNALIELTDSDLCRAGIDPNRFEAYYAKAWSFFLSDEEKRECEAIRTANTARIKSNVCSVGHLVVPYVRSNAWVLANAHYPGDPIRIIYGKAKKIVPGEGGRPGRVIMAGSGDPTYLEADYFLICAGGLATPVLLSESAGKDTSFCDGYHDHPMAYLAKVKLRTESRLKTLSCNPARGAVVRSGFVFETGGVKSIFYLRPAANMALKSICGPARYILSDLRNAPFSPKKILQLLANPDAIKEALIFKTKTGFRGDFYSVLMLGEQIPVPSRGIALGLGNSPRLNWQVTPEEHQFYQSNFEQFMAEFRTEIVDARVIPHQEWEYRTAAHHSGGARKFLAESRNMDLSFFSVKDKPNSYVCDASLLRAGGIANSGLTLVAMSYLLADLLIASL
jgi:hypothetical protein